MEINYIKDNIEKEISKELDIDRRIVQMVANHPFRFFRDIARNKYEIRPVRIRYFGVFVLKNNAKKL